MGSILESFPVRYIDIASHTPISKSYVSQKSTILGRVWETKRDNINDSCRTSITIVDDTGAVVLDTFDENVNISKLTKDKEIVCSGEICEYGGIKHLRNAIFECDFSQKCEVVPFYRLKQPQQQVDVRNQVAQSLNTLCETALLFDGKIELSKREIYGIHGLSSKSELASARKTIKRKQIEAFCKGRGASFDIYKYILCEMGFRFGKQLHQISNVRVVTSNDFGDVCDDLHKRAESRGSVFVFCPLAYMTAGGRDKLCASYFDNSRSVENRPYPNISIECTKDLKNAKQSDVKKREEFYRRVLGEHCDNLHVSASSSFINVGTKSENDILVVEDADRISTIFLFELISAFRGSVVLISNSASSYQLERLNILERSCDIPEILDHEMSFRRDGDILGNKISGANLLSLVNVSRDKHLFSEVERCD